MLAIASVLELDTQSMSQANCISLSFLFLTCSLLVWVGLCHVSSNIYAPLAASTQALNRLVLPIIMLAALHIKLSINVKVWKDRKSVV